METNHFSRSAYKYMGYATIIFQIMRCTIGFGDSIDQQPNPEEPRSELNDLKAQFVEMQAAMQQRIDQFQSRLALLENMMPAEYIEPLASAPEPSSPPTKPEKEIPKKMPENTRTRR